LFFNYAFFNYADDTNLAGPKIRMSNLQRKFKHFKHGLFETKLAQMKSNEIIEIKSKDAVFHRPCPKRLHTFPSVDD